MIKEDEGFLVKGVGLQQGREQSNICFWAYYNGFLDICFKIHE